MEKERRRRGTSLGLVVGKRGGEEEEEPL